MNDNTCDDSTNWFFSLKNGVTPDAAVSAGAALAPTAAVGAYFRWRRQLDNNDEDFEIEEDFTKEWDEEIQERKWTMMTSSMVNMSQNAPRTPRATRVKQPPAL